MDRKGHLARLARAAGGQAVVDALVTMPPRDLNSLLMHVFAARAEQLGPLDLMAAQERGGVFAPGYVEPRTALAAAQAAFDAAAAFEAVELAPVTPLGAARVLGGVHTNNVLAATRGAELVADPTIPLVLMAALRRRDEAARASPLRLCALQRVMRTQPPPMKGLLPHFRIFALMTADRRGREDEALREHIEVYLRLFRTLGERGHRFEDVRVDLSHTAAVEHRLGDKIGAVRREVRTSHWVDPDQLAARYGLAPLRGPAAEVLGAAALPAPIHRRLERIATGVLAPLAAAYPDAQLRLDLTRLTGIGYYDGPCLHIEARPPGAQSFNLVDGGFVRWTADLLSDRRERLLSTGIGIDLLSLKFRAE
jgi:hypothetical protein